MSQTRPQSPRSLLLVNLIWSMALLVLLAVGYTLSYPIVASQTQQYDIYAYRPVQYLVDETAFERPMRWWAGRCGAEGSVTGAALKRKYISWLREVDPGAADPF